MAIDRSRISASSGDRSATGNGIEHLFSVLTNNAWNLVTDPAV